MEYQKIANFLDNGVALNESNQPSKFRTENCVEINDESRGGYITRSDIKFKTTMLRSNFYDYADAYILIKRTIAITGVEDDAAARQTDERNKGLKIVQHLLNA